MSKEKKTSISRFLGSRLFLIIGIPLTVLVVFGVVRSYFNGYKINQEIEALQTDIKSLERKKLESMEILNYVMSSDFVEEKARTELNMKKKDENVMVFKGSDVYDRNKAAAVGIDSQDGSGQKMSNQLKWWYYFTNKNHVLNKQ